MTRKFALVVGNSHYADPALARLKAPEADVHALAGVLRDPAIGGFDDVRELIDEPEHTIRRAIAAFFANKAPSDLLLLYASGHGVLDDQGRLYLATQDTQRDLLNATAIPTSFITDGMDTCRSKRQVLILDCCHSGAFARGSKGELTAITQATFEGNGFGRVVLTASDSTQYALEGDQVDQNVSLSLFTNYLLEGLTSGEADRGRDGWVDVDEWYDYAYEKILLQTSGQTPKKWAYNTQGELVIARNPRPKPVDLPRYLRTAISSELPRVRLEAVDQLENLLSNGEPGLAAVATQELQRMAQDDDSLIVRKRATEALEAHAIPGSPALEEISSQAMQVSQAAQDQERENQQAQELLEKEQSQKAEEERRRREQEETRLQQERERLAQLEALYNSVISKMQAGEWQAAQSSLEELQRVQPDYGDSAKLQKRIAGEIARQKSEVERQARQARQRRLEAQYQDASQAMGREDWSEAQRLFQQLAQETPGYRDVSKQLQVIAGRLAGRPAAVSTRGVWLPVLVTSLGWGIAYAVMIPLVEAYRYDNIYLVATIPALLIAGGVVYSLMLAGLPLSRARLVQLFLLWWGGSALSIGFAVYPEWQGNLVMAGVIPNVLMLPTFAGTGLLLRAYKPSLRWISVLGGWAVALIVDFAITDSILVNYGFNSMEAAELAYGLVGLAIGAIGGWWMYRQLGIFSKPAEKARTGSIRTVEPGVSESRAGSTSAGSTWRNGLPVLVSGLGWGIAWAVLSPLLNSDQIFLGALIPALFMAASTVAAIDMVGGKRVSQRRLAQLFALWWVGLVLTLGFAANPDWQGITVPDIVIPITLLLVTFAGTGLLLRASFPSVSWASILGGLALGVIAGAIAMTAIRPAFPYADLHIFGLHDLGGMPVLGFGGLVGGLIGGGWIRWQLSRGA